MVLVNVVGGCETPNLEFFVSHGGAATADTPEAIAALCKRLLEHDEGAPDHAPVIARHAQNPRCAGHLRLSGYLGHKPDSSVGF